MTDPKAIDISPEAVEKRIVRLESLAERGWIDGDIVDLVSALSAALSEARGKVGEAERERDEAQDAIRREVTAANLQFFSRKTDELGAALLKAEAERDAALSEPTKLCAEAEWWPIKSAPRDGAHFIALRVITADELDEDDRVLRRGVVTREVVVAYYFLGAIVQFPWNGGMPINVRYTHWRPLPSPPKDPAHD